MRAVPPVFVPKAHSLLSDLVDKPFGTTRVSLRPLRGDFNGSSYVLTPTARSLKSLRLLLLRFFALFNILLKYITIFIICQVFFSILQEIYVFGLKSLDFAVKICYNINKAAHKKSMRQRKEIYKKIMEGDRLFWLIALQFALIAVNAFFASAEMALVSLNTNLLRRAAEDGDKKAKKLLKLSEEPTAFLSAIQIAITLAGFLGSAFAADNFADPLTNWVVGDLGFTALSAETINSIAVILITLTLSYFTLVLGELVPKRIAQHAPEKTARLVCPAVAVIKTVLKPIIWVLTVSTNLCLRVFGIRSDEKDDTVTEDEIRIMVDIGEESGTIDATASEMIDNIFEFDNSIARSVMTRAIDVATIPSDASDSEIFEILSESGYSRFPVCGENINDVIGILYAKDYYLDRLSNSENKPLASLLRPAHFVPETVKCDVLSAICRKANAIFR